jgi:hypothetical protein
LLGVSGQIGAISGQFLRIDGDVRAVGYPGKKFGEALCAQILKVALRL